jgi:O-antigen/teichoic acid export membrane protein
VIGLLAVLGTDQGVAFHESRMDERGDLWASALLITTIIGSILVLLATVLQDRLALLLTNDVSNRSAIVAAAVYGEVIGLTTLALNAIRLRGSPREYALASFLAVTAEMAGALVVAWLVPAPVTPMVLAWSFGALLIVAPVLVHYLPRLRAPSRPTVRRLATYGAPLVPAAVAWLIGDAWIRSSLARGADLAMVGEYGIAFRIASVLGFAVTGFGVAWHPYIYRSPAEQIVLRARQTLPFLLLALGSVGVLLTALSPELVEVVAGPKYAAARAAVSGLSGAMIVLGGFVLVSAVVGAAGSTQKIAFAAIVGAGCQVLLAGPLVSAFGLTGAAMASLTGYVVGLMALVAGARSLLSGTSAAVNGGILLLVSGGIVLANVLPPNAWMLRLALALGFAVAASVGGLWLHGRLESRLDP